jgi:hypothetical protein
MPLQSQVLRFFKTSRYSTTIFTLSVANFYGDVTLRQRKGDVFLSVIHDASNACGFFATASPNLKSHPLSLSCQRGNIAVNFTVDN